MRNLWLLIMTAQALQQDEDPRTSPTIKLSNGIVIPRVGYGCAGKASARYVEHALREGVRLIDTAQADEWYDEAAAAVPDEFIDEAALIGPKDRIRKRYRDWVDAGFTGLTVGTSQEEAMTFMAELAGLNRRG